MFVCNRVPASFICCCCWSTCVLPRQLYFFVLYLYNYICASPVRLSPLVGVLSALLASLLYLLFAFVVSTTHAHTHTLSSLALSLFVIYPFFFFPHTLLVTALCFFFSFAQTHTSVVAARSSSLRCRPPSHASRSPPPILFSHTHDTRPDCAFIARPGIVLLCIVSYCILY